MKSHRVKPAGSCFPDSDRLPGSKRQLAKRWCRLVATLSMLMIVGAEPEPAAAYELQYSSGGAPLHWRAGYVSVFVDPSYSDLDPDGVVAASWNALHSWESALGGVLEFVEAEDPEDAQIVIELDPSWSSPVDAIAVTHNAYGVNSGELRAVSIVLNRRDFVFGFGDPDRHDLESTFAHELGHALGLAHESDVLEATMYPSQPVGEMIKRDPAPDDIAGINALYVMVALGEDPNRPFASGCSVARVAAHTSAARDAGLIVLLLLGWIVRRRAAGRECGPERE